MGYFSELAAQYSWQDGQPEEPEMAEIYELLNGIYEDRADYADTVPAAWGCPQPADPEAPRRNRTAAAPPDEPRSAQPAAEPVRQKEAPDRQTVPPQPADSRPAAEQNRPAAPPAEAQIPEDPETVWLRSGLEAMPLFVVPDTAGTICMEGPVQDPADWPEPLPLSGEIPLPEFPADCLPDFMRDYVLQVAEATQTPPAMAGLLSLAVLAACLQGRYDCRISRSWKESLSLYTVAEAKTGERKSSVFELLVSPIRAYEQERLAAELVEADVQRSRRQTMEQKLELARKAAAEGSGTMEEVERLAAALSRMQERSPLQILIDDCTPEKLAGLLADHPGGLLAASPEGGIFQMMKGTKDRPPKLDVFLKAWDAEDIRVERVTRGTVVAREPHLSILLTVQPSVLRSVMASEELMSRGLCARFLYVSCQSRIGARQARPREITDAAAQAYQDGIRRLLEGTGSGTLTLSPDADATLIRWQEDIEKLLISDWDDDAMQGWGNKLAGQTVRIACLLHAAETAVPEAVPVADSTFRRARRIAECLAFHARHVFQSGQDQTEDLRYCLRRLQQLQKQHPVVTRTMAQRSLRRLQPAARLSRTLEQLERLRYIRLRREMTAGAPRQVLELNPRSQDFCGP